MIEDVSATAKKAPDPPRKRAPGLKRDPPSRGGPGVNIFEEYKTKDNRKSDAALLKDQYLRDDAVETFKNATRRKGHDFQNWLKKQEAKGGAQSQQDSRMGQRVASGRTVVGIV